MYDNGGDGEGYLGPGGESEQGFQQDAGQQEYGQDNQRDQEDQQYQQQGGQEQQGGEDSRDDGPRPGALLTNSSPSTLLQGILRPTCARGHRILWTSVCRVARLCACVRAALILCVCLLPSLLCRAARWSQA